MKNLYHTLMLFMAQIVSLASYAHDFSENGIFYNYVDNNRKTIEVTHRTVDNGLYLYSGEITIPEKVTHLGKTYTVVGIGERAFAGCISLQSVKLPTSVTKINPQMFALCISLQSITIPKGVEYIGEEAFYDCWNLQTIFVPSSLEYIGLF